MIKRLILSIMLVLSINCYSQRICLNDKWNSTNGAIIKYDKVEHALGSGCLYAGLRLIKQSDTKAYQSAVLLGVVWEIKDSLYDWEMCGKMGGEGFSFKDVYAGIAGVVITRLIWKLIKGKQDVLSYRTI